MFADSLRRIYVDSQDQVAAQIVFVDRGDQIVGGVRLVPSANCVQQLEKRYPFANANSLEHRDKTAIIDRGFFDPAFRGRGLYSHVHDLAIELAGSLKIDRLFVAFAADNIAFQKAHERRGWKRIATFMPSTEYASVHVYAKNLKENSK